MLQRIQTIFLALGATALVLLLLFGRFWSGPAAESQGWFTPTVYALGGLAALVGIIAIFLYNDRPRQRTIIVVAQTLTVLHLLALYLGLFLADVLTIRTSSGIDVGALVVLLLPLVAYLLFFMARRAVEKDIELVRSMDRLR